MWDRDLELDLARLRDELGVELLVPLLEPHEYTMLQIPDLIERAREVRHDDAALSDPRRLHPGSMAGAQRVVLEVLSEVARGTTAVIHCRGGIGRSGIIAAACLVARGVEPDDAIARVRRVRPGAVETSEQERWVHEFARSLSGSAAHASATPALRDRFRGCLLGGALGDALGYPVEFLSAR